MHNYWLETAAGVSPTETVGEGSCGAGDVGTVSTGGASVTVPSETVGAGSPSATDGVEDAVAGTPVSVVVAASPVPEETGLASVLVPRTVPL